jgi:hypothetical protein
VNSKTTQRFRRAFAALPRDVQRQARESYLLFQNNPRHPGLWFKRIHARQPIYSARISLGYRALGVMEGDEIIWFWLGTHAEYDLLVSRL